MWTATILITARRITSATAYVEEPKRYDPSQHVNPPSDALCGRRLASRFIVLVIPVALAGRPQDIADIQNLKDGDR